MTLAQCLSFLQQFVREEEQVVLRERLHSHRCPVLRRQLQDLLHEPVPASVVRGWRSVRCHGSRNLYLRLSCLSKWVDLLLGFREGAVYDLAVSC